ncbi:hypothetical protein ID866_11386, partial [Astraeus odoratus]
MLLVLAHPSPRIVVTLNLPSTAWRATCCGLIVIVIATALPRAYTGNGLLDYFLGASLGTCILESIRFLLLTRPLQEFRHESDKVPAYQLPFVQRYLWVTSISPRGFGWSFGAAPPIVSTGPRHLTRTSFVFSRSYRIFLHYFLFHAILWYTSFNPVFTSSASLGSQGYVLRCLNVIAIPCLLYASFTCVYYGIALAAVGTNIHQPSLWPDPFGSWKDAYTIRRFWGRTWHQFSRHNLTIFGPHLHSPSPSDQALSAASHANHSSERLSWKMSYLRLCNAFICSAFMHMCGDVVLQSRIRENLASASASSYTKIGSNDIIGFSVPFFLLQPMGVLVEDAIMEAWKRLALKQGKW